MANARTRLGTLRQYFFVGFVFVGFLSHADVTWPSFAQRIHFRCATWLGRFDAPLALSNSEREKLNPRIARYLEIILNQTRRRTDIFPPNVEMTFNDIPVTVVTFLGEGTEGKAYLVRTGTGLAVMKQFRAELFKWSLKSLRMNSHERPCLIDVDESYPAILLQYIPGIPLDWLLSDVRGRNRLVLSRAEIVRVERIYHAKLNDFKDRRFITVNWLYDFEQLRQID